MKTILIPTEDHDSMPAVLETARRIAHRFDSYMEGFAVYPALGEFVAVVPVSSLTMPQGHASDVEVERQARNLFESFMAANAVPRAPPPPRQQVTYSYGWSRPTAQADAFIGRYGRVFDLV